MSKESVAATIRAALRTIEMTARPLFAPAIIAGVMIVFLTLTFAAARLASYLFDAPSRHGLFILWAIASAAGVMLVRLIPRLLR